MSIQIRPAILSDAQAISDIILPLTQKYVCPTCDTSVHQRLLDSMSKENIESYLSTHYSYFVAENTHQGVVGIVGMRDHSHLFHLFVSDDYQGRGLARRLWEAAREDALKHGNTGCFTVNSALNAENTYLRFGFKRTQGVRSHDGMVDIPMILKPM